MKIKIAQHFFLHMRYFAAVNYFLTVYKIFSKTTINKKQKARF